jgi:hypothetical protein
MKNIQHTPTPWNFIDVMGACALYAGQMEILNFRNPVPKARANAAFIVRAVNAHEELLENLKWEHSNRMDGKPCLASCAVCSVIAKAESL